VESIEAKLEKGKEEKRELLFKQIEVSESGAVRRCSGIQSVQPMNDSIALAQLIEVFLLQILEPIRFN
jgi:hypothetical protein